MATSEPESSPHPSITEKDCCEVTLVHEETVESIRNHQLSPEKIQSMSLIFQALGDPTRVRMIHVLIQSEVCVCDLAAVLEMTQSAISHQLRYLHNLRLVKRRKSGRMVYYSIDDEHILTLFETCLNHISHK